MDGHACHYDHGACHERASEEMVDTSSSPAPGDPRPTGLLEDASLVVEGGGMRGFFSAGVLSCLRDESVLPANVIAVSSGTLSAINYVAGAPRPDFARLGEIKGASLLNPHGLINPKAGLMRLGPLIGTLVGDSLGYALRSPQRLRVCATDARTGELTWWSQRDCVSETDLLDRAVASCSIPVVMPQKTIGDVVYADGGIRDSIPLSRARMTGATRHLLVLSRPRGYRKPPQHLELYLRTWLAPYPLLKNAMLRRHIRYNEAIQQVEAAEDAGEALVFRPSMQRVARFQYDPRAFELDWEDGYRACQKRIDEVRAFLGEGQGNAR